MRALKITLAVLAAGFALIMLIGAMVDPAKSDERRRQRCAEAIMSSVGTSTLGYADRAAYRSHVDDRCAGFDLPKQ